MLKGFATNRTNANVWGQSILPWVLAAFIALLIADIAILYTRSFMLPSTQLPPRGQQQMAYNVTQRGSLESIRARNIFASSGMIPDPISANGTKDKQEEAAPVLSQLPLGLVGTLVHSNPEKSMASIDVKNKNQVLSYTTKKEIEGLAVIERIERGKVFIRNNSTGAMEYIELKMESKLNFGSNAPAPTGASAGGGKDVKVLGENKFEIKQADLLKYTGDLSSVLMQARAVPAKRPGTGEIYGFRILEIQPGSIFAQLGLMPMDVITSVNGTPVTNVQQAMELYAALRNSTSLKIGNERNGKVENFDYTITK
ncbi:MAG: type II secretion system protein GspC [Bdellovibrionota bacterium]